MLTLSTDLIGVSPEYTTKHSKYEISCFLNLSIYILLRIGKNKSYVRPFISSIFDANCVIEFMSELYNLANVPRICQQKFTEFNIFQLSTDMEVLAKLTMYDECHSY